MYDAMLAVAHGKPMALAEVGQIPTPQQLAAQPRWTYFMCWSEYLTDPAYNSNDSIKTTYYDARVLNQGTLDITPGNPASENLALGRPAYASSAENSSTPAAAAFDAAGNTRWSSAYTDPQWIYVDLGAAHRITTVTLTWENAYARKYQIQTSTDAQNWTTAYENDAGDGGTDAIALNTSARYVKMYAWQRSTPFGYSLWDFAVTGN
jgi:mannan endo-1,4-beta-mannosidase